MLRALIVAIVCLMSVPAWAVTSFVVPFPDTDNSRFVTEVGNEWVPIFRNPLHDPIVDLRSVTRYSFQIQGSPVSGSTDIEATIQVSFDGGLTFECLGQECVIVTIPAAYHTAVAPSNIMSIPTSQRKQYALLRVAVRSSDGTSVQGTHTMALVQLYHLY